MQAQTVLFEDDFESYDNFIFENVGSWSLVDLDGTNSYGSNDYDFDNEGYTGSYIVFNPSATTPASTGTAWDTYAGDKGFLLFFCHTNKWSYK